MKDIKSNYSLAKSCEPLKEIKNEIHWNFISISFEVGIRIVSQNHASHFKAVSDESLKRDYR